MDSGRSTRLVLVGMVKLHIFGLVIVGVYLYYRFCGERRPGLFLTRMAILCVASWLVEDTAIRLYQFYHYHPGWKLFIGNVPVIVVVAWPAVIYSEWELASQLLTDKQRLIPWAAAMIVWIDASLIEAIAVNAGLWSWRFPGVFKVPFIGIFGWAFFTFFSVFFLGRQQKERMGISAMLALLAIPVIATHGLLVGTWWLIFRWFPAPANPILLAIAAWILSLLLSIAVMRNRLGEHVERKVLTNRLPAVLFFTVLLIKASTGATAGNPLLPVYVSAFAPPYLLLYLKKLGPYTISGNS